MKEREERWGEPNGKIISHQYRKMLYGNQVISKLSDVIVCTLNFEISTDS